MTNNPNPVAGWYPDPQNPMWHRYWDGSTWTDQTRPALPPYSGSQPPSNSLLKPTFVEAIKEAFVNIFKFKGRSSRRSYWFFVLFYALFYVLVNPFIPDFSVISLFVTVSLMLVGLAVAIRRLHDVNRSGWFVLVPFVNIYFYCQPGDTAPNRYGAAPGSNGK